MFFFQNQNVFFHVFFQNQNSAGACAYIYIYIYIYGRPEEGRFVRPKYRRKLKLCHLFICVLLFTSCLEKPSTQHLMFL